ncbi:MAG: ATP-binding protein [Thiogranum sp.]|nr:ATP-binding protein [Thiogranum sp.]
MSSPRDIRHKGEKHLIWGFIITLLLMQGVAALVLIEMSAVNDAISHSLNVQREKAVHVSGMRDAMRKRQVGLRDMVILPDAFLKDEAWQTFFNSASDFIIARQLLEELGLTEEERLALQRLSEKAAAAYETQQAVVDLVFADATVQEVAPLLQVATASQNHAAEEMTGLILMQQESAGLALELSDRHGDDTLIMLLFVGAIAAFAAIVIAVIALIRDRKLMNDLGNYRHHLQDLVTERTRQQEDLVRELESFSYSLAHDLRQPLRGLDGYSFILLEDYSDKLDTTGRHYLERIRAGSQRIGHLLDGMLTLCNLSRAGIRRTEVDLSSVCHEIVAQLAPDQSSRRVDWRIASEVAARADTDLVRIALENLLSNSLKFTTNTPGAIIEFGCDSGTAEPVHFVRDNGAGFDMQHANKLFGAFERLHSVEEFEGTGIGLATVRRIVERHGGRIWAEAEPGNGATFFFTLNEYSTALDEPSRSS